MFMVNQDLTQAVNFALDVQVAMQQEGACMADLGVLKKVLMRILPKYPGCSVGEDILFQDYSAALITRGGILTKDDCLEPWPNDGMD
jgi:hypothetical protein